MIDICESFWSGHCGCFDEDDPENAPTNCDDDGNCIDEYDNSCDSYGPADNYCGNCGKLYENCECED